METKQIKTKELRKIKAKVVDEILGFCLNEFVNVYKREYGIVPDNIEDLIRKHLNEMQLEVEIREGKIVGFVSYSDEGDHLLLQDQAVIPELRGTGLNVQLLKRIEEKAKRQGKKFLQARMHRVQVQIIKMALKFKYAITGFSKHILIIEKSI
jgi:N-acetylglutamate synthase-like GNAT family acetyltransferase